MISAMAFTVLWFSLAILAGFYIGVALEKTRRDDRK